MESSMKEEIEEAKHDMHKNWLSANKWGTIFKIINDGEEYLETLPNDYVLKLIKGLFYNGKYNYLKTLELEKKYGGCKLFKELDKLSDEMDNGEYVELNIKEE